MTIDSSYHFLNNIPVCAVATVRRNLKLIVSFISSFVSDKNVAAMAGAQ